MRIPTEERYNLLYSMRSVGEYTHDEYPTFREFAKALKEGRVLGDYKTRLIVISDNPGHDYTFVAQLPAVGKFESKLKLIGYESYEAYLRSPHWQSIRERVLEQTGNRCYICGDGGKVNVHHCSYEHLGEEQDEDVIALCARCHMKVHDRI